MLFFRSSKISSHSSLQPSCVNKDSVSASELHGSGRDVEHGGVELLPFEGGTFHVPALLQHVVHLLWREKV